MKRSLCMLAGLGLVLSGCQRPEPAEPVAEATPTQLSASLQVAPARAEAGAEARAGAEDEAGADDNALRLDTLPRASNRWFERFAPADIPRDAFLAYYFDSTKPDAVAKSEVVPRIVVNYAWDQGDGFRIASENFAGYWVGQVNVAESGVYTLAVSQSWADVRVIMDERLLPEEDESHLWLDAGYHQLEVEFLNNWHTTDFAVNLLPLVRQYSAPEARAALRALEQDVEVWYAGVYESAQGDHAVTVNLSARAPVKVLLVLSSYSQVHWQLVPAPGVDLVAVAVHSYEPGTTVDAPSGVGNVLTLTRGEGETIYTLDTNCNDINGAVFHCENIHELRKLDAHVEEITGRRAAAFAGRYGAEQLDLPGLLLDAAERARLEQESSAVEQQRREFQQRQTPETLFPR